MIVDSGIYDIKELRKNKVLINYNDDQWLSWIFFLFKVGFGRNGSLFALEHGKVYVTCEKIDPNWDHTWIQRNYAGRENQTIYKKFFNVISVPQHNRFKLIDEI